MNDEDRSFRLAFAIQRAMSEEIQLSKAHSAELLVLRVEDNSVVGYTKMEDAGDRSYYIHEFENGMKIPPTSPTVFYAAAYLDLIERGATLADIVSIEDQDSIECKFVKGQYEAIDELVDLYYPESCYELDLDFCQMYLHHVVDGAFKGFIDDYQDFKKIQLHPVAMLKWMNHVARGEDFIEAIPDDKNNPQVAIHADSVKKLQTGLRLCVTDGVAKAANIDTMPISGITYVSKPDGHWWRSLSFCGYFPSNDPKYGIFIDFKRKEQLDDVVMDEWPELGIYPARLCRKVVEAFMKFSKTFNQEEKEDG